MPTGRASCSSRAVAATLPVLVNDNVTVIGPAFGEGPLVTDSDLVTVTAEVATVVVSRLVSAGLPEVSDTETVIVPCCGAVAVPGTVPATTKRKTPPIARGPVVVIGVKLSGTPLLSASM